jgi:hypothetical protein
MGRIYLDGTREERASSVAKASDSCFKTTRARAPAPHRTGDLLVFLP